MVILQSDLQSLKQTTTFNREKRKDGRNLVITRKHMLLLGIVVVWIHLLNSFYY